MQHAWFGCVCKASCMRAPAHPGSDSSQKHCTPPASNGPFSARGVHAATPVQAMSEDVQLLGSSLFWHKSGHLGCRFGWAQAPRQNGEDARLLSGYNANATAVEACIQAMHDRWCLLPACSTIRSLGWAYEQGFSKSSTKGQVFLQRIVRAKSCGLWPPNLCCWQASGQDYIRPATRALLACWLQQQAICRRKGGKGQAKKSKIGMPRNSNKESNQSTPGAPNRRRRLQQYSRGRQGAKAGFSPRCGAKILGFGVYSLTAHMY